MKEFLTSLLMLAVATCFAQYINNEIHIQSSPPTCEYGHEEYSVNALRVADYYSKPGSPDGCFRNKIYHNKIYVTGKDYPGYPDYIPMAYAVFYSASAGDSYFFGNDIRVDEQTPGQKNETSGFYIGGGTIGGKFFNNRITTDVYTMWVASQYGGDMNTKIYDNAILKSATAKTGFKPIRMGWAERKDCVAKDVEFRSNKFEGFDFGIDATNQPHSYSVWWTLKINVADKNGIVVKKTDIQIMDRNGNEVIHQQTNDQGLLQVELQEYSVNDEEQTNLSPYTVVVGKKERKS